MNTDSFIHQFRIKHQYDEEWEKLEKIAYAIYEHPTTVKILEVAGILFGLASLALLPIVYPYLGKVTVLLALAGGTIALISFVAYYALDIVAPGHHSMQTHVFEEATYGAGKVYYQGDIPILELNSDDPYQAGVAHGYLMGKSLNVLLKQLNFIKTLARHPQADQLPETLQAIHKTLPEEYIQELQGIVEGFNQWSKEYQWFPGHEVTLDDLLLFHLMPDSCHFSPQECEGIYQHPNDLKGNAAFAAEKGHIPSLACTVVIDEDRAEGLTFGRNMDWPSFGVFGTYSIMINRKYSDQRLSTVELGLPGFVGTLTGMNKNGVSLAMNVCSGDTTSVQGMPAAFFNRQCLETCHTVKEVTSKLEKEHPLGSYHLTVADATSAKSFQTNEETSPVIREWKAGKPLITTNCKYRENQESFAPMHCSAEREQLIQALFDEAVASVAPDQLEKAKLVEASLALPYVDNSITAHKVMMYPESKRIQVVVDNAFAGRADLQELDTELLFA